MSQAGTWWTRRTSLYGCAGSGSAAGWTWRNFITGYPEDESAMLAPVREVHVRPGGADLVRHILIAQALIPEYSFAVIMHTLGNVPAELRRSIS